MKQSWKMVWIWGGREKAMSDNPLPPQNIEAEQRVLGAVFLKNAVLGEICGVLEARDFFRNPL